MLGFCRHLIKHKSSDNIDRETPVHSDPAGAAETQGKQKVVPGLEQLAIPKGTSHGGKMT